ncbi:MAG: tyrosine-type recombinase/integrase [Ethanoligenens sp.]
MANITKRKSKNGNVSYLIRVYVDETGTGHQIVKSMTWKPKPSMRPSAEEKELNKQAALFEEQVKNGLVTFGGSTRFADYAKEWIQAEQIAPKTREGYQELLKRIIPAIGHIRLDKLQAHHLEAFYQNLTEAGINQRGKFAVSRKLRGNLKELSLSYEALAKRVGISSATVSAAVNGKHIRVEKAVLICTALKMPLEDVFDVNTDVATLSGNTILHYHRLISAILAKAKRERLVPFNVAAEHTTAPKAHHKEAHYLDDKQARVFLDFLLEEPDIRIKTAFILLLFTGLRRGELCGLSWSDINFERHLVNIERASQYQIGKGVVEKSTKNDSSIRSIKIPAFVIEQLSTYRAWWNKQKLLYGESWHGEKERLFVQANGKPINPDTINFWMNRFLEQHQLEHITPHSLRHTFATLQIAAGVDIRTLQARTGHAQASTLVNIYSHAIKSAQEAASDALEDLLLPPTDKSAGKTS